MKGYNVQLLFGNVFLFWFFKIFIHFKIVIRRYKTFVVNNFDRENKKLVWENTFLETTENEFLTFSLFLKILKLISGIVGVEICIMFSVYGGWWFNESEVSNIWETL